MIVEPKRFAAAFPKRTMVGPNETNCAAALRSRIKETARNEEITSAYICHDYLRSVRCTVRGRGSRQCRRLFSNKPCFRYPRPRNDNRPQPEEPLGCFVRERGVPSGFRTRAQILPRFIR